MEGLTLDFSEILGTISSVLSSNWSTVVAILGIAVAVPFLIRMIKRAAGR